MMMNLAAVLALCFSVVASEESPIVKARYSHHSVLRCVPETQDHVNKLRVMDSQDSTRNQEGIRRFEFWMEPRKIGTPVDVFVHQDHRKEIEDALTSAGIGCRVMIANVQDVIDNEVAPADTPFLQNYHEFSEIHSYLDGLVAEFPTLASTSTIGKTYQGKDIKIITLSTDPKAKKPALWFDGGLHAREWIAVATVTYMADNLVRTYGKNADSTFLLDNFDVIFCPIINVDGYDYTWNGDRMWRKTRSPNSKSKCVGTDPNRNWAYHWGEAGANDIACSDSYQGPAPASEIETKTVQDYICNNNATIKGYVNFHSYEQLWMSNWGYTDELPPDYQQQNELSKAVVDAIFSVHGTKFDYGPISTIIYPASGSSADYTYAVCGVKYSYGAELRDTGEYGFLLPADQIIPSGEETFAGIVAMGKYIANNP